MNTINPVLIWITAHAQIIYNTVCSDLDQTHTFTPSLMCLYTPMPFIAKQSWSDLSGWQIWITLMQQDTEYLEPICFHLYNSTGSTTTNTTTEEITSKSNGKTNYILHKTKPILQTFYAFNCEENFIFPQKLNLQNYCDANF